MCTAMFAAAVQMVALINLPEVILFKRIRQVSCRFVMGKTYPPHSLKQGANYGKIYERAKSGNKFLPLINLNNWSCLVAGPNLHFGKSPCLPVSCSPAYETRCTRATSLSLAIVRVIQVIFPTFYGKLSHLSIFVAPQTPGLHNFESFFLLSHQ